MASSPLLRWWLFTCLSGISPSKVPRQPTQRFGAHFQSYPRKMVERPSGRIRVGHIVITIFGFIIYFEYFLTARYFVPLASISAVPVSPISALRALEILIKTRLGPCHTTVMVCGAWDQPCDNWTLSNSGIQSCKKAGRPGLIIFKRLQICL